MLIRVETINKLEYFETAGKLDITYNHLAAIHGSLGGSEPVVDKIDISAANYSRMKSAIQSGQLWVDTD